MKSIYFEKNTWVDLQEIIKEDPVVLLPYGTIEEHGPHCPIGTDYILAKKIGKGIAEKCKELNIPVLVLPAIWTGYSQKIMYKWPGTMSLKIENVINILYDTCSSLIRMGLKKIIVIDNHGHHGGAFNVAIRKIHDDFGVGVPITSPATLTKEIYAKIRKSKPGGSAHAGEWETSLDMYFGEPVEMSRAVAYDNLKYNTNFINGDNFTGDKKVWWSTWVREKSESGTFGDPTEASPETGKILYEECIKLYIEFIREFNDFHKKERKT